MRNKQITFSCTGCSACCNICPVNAIEMIENEEGFKYPQIDSNKCINCGLCEKICPVLNKTNLKPSEIKTVFAVSTNDEIRQNSSSGGVFTLLANFVLEQDG